MTNNIRMFRIEKGLSQFDLAVRANLNNNQISIYERGLRCSSKTKEKIAMALEKTIEEVFPSAMTTTGKVEVQGILFSEALK